MALPPPVWIIFPVINTLFSDIFCGELSLCYILLRVEEFTIVLFVFPIQINIITK
jgi:hypothetical protein